MEGRFDRPLTLSESLEKAQLLLEEGTADFEAMQEAERELEVRKRTAEACQKAFHALVVLADGLLAEHGLEAGDHDERMEKLRSIDADDLADVYQRTIYPLHVSGYYRQRIGPLQRRALEDIRQAVDRELDKLR